MASSPKQILAVLGMLAAYYNKEPTEAQASVYLEALSGLDPSVLHDSARLWIQRSPFFPKVSEILQIAHQVPARTPDYLANRVQMLEDAFYQDRTLDPQAWQALADEFDRLERPHRALHTRQKLAAFQSILEQESRQELKLPSLILSEDEGWRGESSAQLSRDEV